MWFKKFIKNKMVSIHTTPHFTHQNTTLHTPSIPSDGFISVELANANL